MATIYRKTAKGQTEIETRALRLAPRLRSALILVDGRRSDDDLRKLLLQQAEETLHTLSEQGFIEIIGITHDANAARPAPGMPPSPPSGGTPPPSASAFSAPQTRVAAAAATEASLPAPGPVRSFEATRADAVRAFTDLVGPMAEALAIKMERTRSLDELRPLVQTAQAVIGNSRGNQAAVGYLSRVYGSARG